MKILFVLYVNAALALNVIIPTLPSDQSAVQIQLQSTTNPHLHAEYRLSAENGRGLSFREYIQDKKYFKQGSKLWQLQQKILSSRPY